ncbi:uncharacterized protein [Ptychodera flava]|uniref:uncharacterized protein n=1 Tax=Ptychodera flava TaxID=63121 RepID=UPI00396A466B
MERSSEDGGLKIKRSAGCANLCNKKKSLYCVLLFLSITITASAVLYQEQSGILLANAYSHAFGNLNGNTSTLRKARLSPVPFARGTLKKTDTFDGTLGEIDSSGGALKKTGSSEDSSQNIDNSKETDSAKDSLTNVESSKAAVKNTDNSNDSLKNIENSKKETDKSKNSLSPEVASSLTNLTEYAKSCRKVNNVAYIFNRKTGSTTLVTLIDRFTKNNAFPLQRTVIYHRGTGYKGSLELYHVNGENHEETTLPVLGTKRQNRILVSREGGTLNIESADEQSLKCSTRSPDTILVSIVREPSANFESAFNFFRLDRFVPLKTQNRGSKLEEYFKKPDYYFKRITERKVERFIAVARNGQAWHLGLDQEYHNDPKVVDKYFSRLNEELDLVFVTEYYDHSLVLLKRIMCWKMEDILYVARRVRSKRTPLSDKLKDKIRKWNFVDVKIYDMFNKTLWRKIAQYGPEFEKDLQDFRLVRDTVSKDCDKFGNLSNNAIELLSRFGSNVSPQFCKKLGAWFTMAKNTGIQRGYDGTDMYFMTLAGKGPWKGLPAKSTSKKATKSFCVQTLYHKLPSSSKRPGLDLYMSTSGETPKCDFKVQKLQNDSYIALKEIDNVENLQITATTKFTNSEFFISRIAVQNGHCTFSSNATVH